MQLVLRRVLAVSAVSATVVASFTALQAHQRVVAAAGAEEVLTSLAPTTSSLSLALHDSADRALSEPPTPAPAPVSTPAATPVAGSAPQPYRASAGAAPARPAPPAPKPPAPAPVARFNWLRSDDGSVNTGVGWYTDCTGQSAVPRGYAEIDTCVHDVVYYFVGHHPGVFNGLVNMPVGAGITYWDGAGHAHHYVIVARRIWQSANGAPPAIGQVEFQTCVDSAGVQDYILDANPG